MKQVFIFSLSVALFALAGCKPESKTAAIVTEQQVLSDFSAKLANPNYQDIQTNASTLKLAVSTFENSPTDANLIAAQTAWRNTRAPWEGCESYLFGPVDDQSYDPTMDTWPLNKNDLDVLLASSNGLSTAEVDSLPSSLKGFHAIEYVLFGSGTAAQVAANPRKMLYLRSLTESLYNVTTALRNSWDPAQGNYSAKLSSAGTATSPFASREDAFVAIVTGMTDICGEVASGKMQDPLANPGFEDSLQSESRFSHNSTTDFTNNIKGVRSAYMCQYGGGSAGASLHNLVAQKNASLDNRITSKIEAAIAAFNTVNSNYEVAIYTQRAQIVAVQQAITELQTVLDTELKPYLIAVIAD